ncbi:MAG: alpha/beta hydrolase [Acidovorax sp.]|jgi:2-hydroxy-6-oxonona-2,4-dienedioate hydrolase|uniref:alpha/beta fold hydrolase n=1 Tax=Acidovorax sp. TaxID=1872122 RepID=UPI00262A1A85|nr:alpha/beta hydrolase [Acidovorax sp.]MDH4462992.1 alpha/beta hydrolase [Acidovorax sp.]
MSPAAIEKAAPMAAQAHERECSREAVMDHEGGLLRIHYTDTGSSARHAPVVALLHGSGPGTTGWSAFALQRPALEDAGFRLITPDLPGWGRSDGVVCKEDRSQFNARALHAVLDAAGVHEPVHLVGTSMGAHSAVAFALQWPGRAARMVLASGGTGGRSNFHPTLPEGVRAMMDFYQEPTAARMRSFLECVVFDSSALTPEMAQQKVAAAMACPQHLENFVASLRRYPTQFGDVTHRLAEITLPTLVIWGSEDRVVPLDIGLQIAQRIPGADLHMLGRCGHVPHLERPRDFIHLLTRFLA